MYLVLLYYFGLVYSINWNFTAFSVNDVCNYYKVKSGDTCSLISIKYGISISDIERYNKNNYNWRGCNNLQINYLLCVSSGLFPRPISNPKAECGPYAPGALFNSKCPLNACCSQYGFCGLTSEFCGDNCYSNCGIGNLHDGHSSGTIAYWMDGGSLNNLDYDIVHYAFVDINSDFSISDSKFSSSGFMNISPKKVVSFGGWDFSTNSVTYNVFRSGVQRSNMEILSTNIANFANKYNLDGVDLDWEYPGAPDIPGIPPDDKSNGRNYLSFIRLLKSKLGLRTLSVAIPSSYWYLKNFPLKAMSDYVDYFVFMTYDLYGVWDIDRDNSIKCHVNQTAISDSMRMLDKAGIDISKVYGGIANYGRSYKASSHSCLKNGCPFNGPGNKRDSTNTPGVLSQNEIINMDNINDEWFDPISQCNFMRYDGDSIVGYTKDVNKQSDFIKSHGFKGTVLWAHNYYENNNVEYDYLDDIWEQIDREELEYLGTLVDFKTITINSYNKCNKDPTQVLLDTETDHTCLFLRMTFELIGPAYDAISYFNNVNRIQYAKDHALFVQNVQDSLWTDFGDWIDITGNNRFGKVKPHGDGQQFYRCKGSDDFYECVNYLDCNTKDCIPYAKNVANIVLKEGMAKNAAISLSNFTGLTINETDFITKSKRDIAMYNGIKISYRNCDFADFSMAYANPLDNITYDYIDSAQSILDKINAEYKDYPMGAYYSLTPLVALIDISENMKSVQDQAAQIRKIEREKRILMIINYVFMGLAILAMPFGIAVGAAIDTAALIASEVAEYKLTGKISADSLAFGLIGIIAPFIKNPTSKIDTLFNEFDLNSLGKLKGKFKANKKYEDIISKKIC